jgi:hypothetical protein
MPALSSAVLAEQRKTETAGMVSEGAMTWHVWRNGKAWGPITFDDLKRAALDGRVRLDDLLWQPGMVNWQPASQISGL